MEKIKKLSIQIIIVTFLLSLPIWYLGYSSYQNFYEHKQVAEYEINGAKITLKVLDEMSRHLFEHKINHDEEFFKSLLPETLIKEFPISESEQSEILNLDKKNFIEFSYGIIRIIANNSKLILDPDIDSYYAMDILSLQLPRIYLELFQNPKKIIDFRDLNYSLKQISQTHHENTFIQLKNCYIDQSSAAYLVLKKCATLNTSFLINVLNKRIDLLTYNFYLTLVFTAIIWIVGLVLGFYIYMKTMKKQFEDSLKILDQEKMILEAEKLSTLGELASSIVHEIKNPLSLIDFESKKLIKKYSENDNSDANTVLKLTKIIEMSKRINRISNLVTIYTRNSQNDSFEEVSCIKIIEDAVYIVNLKAKNNDVKITVNAHDFPLFCRPYQIEQVIINLLNNSIDAIENLADKWISISAESLDGQIKIKIMDSGLGIKKEVYEKMFHSFYSTKTAGKGTGLGLSVSYKILEAHQGKLYYDDKSANTQFIIELPKMLVIE